MASNATFEVEIYGNTTKFENSLKGVNTAMSGLRGEAKNLREALKLDPANTGKMAQLQKNLQTQLSLSRDKATKLKEELSNVDKGTSSGQKKWLQLTRDLGTAETQANRLEGEIKQVEAAISSGSWNIDAKMDTKGVNSGIDGMKSRFSSLREIAVGAFRQIGASAVSAVGNGLKGWVSDAMDTQKAMISLQNTMKFKGNGQDFDYVSKSMQKLAKDTNANSEDTLKLSTTFVGLGDSAKTAVGKTEALVKANQAFGGTGETLKGVVQAYGQMSAAGKVTAENINQLTDNNTALGSALKSTVMEMNPALKQYGSFAEASENGAVSVEMLDKAMQQLGKAGGGGVTTISDAWDTFNETLSQALLPTLDALTPIISALIDKMSGWGESAGKAIGSIVKYVKELWGALEKNGALSSFSEIWDGLKSTFGSVISIIGRLIESFAGIESKTGESAGSVENVSKTIANLAKGLAGVIKKIANFAKKFSESKGAIDALKSSLVTLTAGFVAFKIGSGIVTAIGIFQKLQTAIQAGTGAMGAFNAVMAINPFVALGAAVAAVVASLVYFFTQTETGKKAWASFVDFLKSAWDSVVSFFSGIGQWFAYIWNGVVDGAKGIWQGLVDWFSGIIQGIQNIWNGITTFFSNLWTTVIGGIQSVWGGVTGFFGGIFNAVRGIVSSVFSAIGSFASSSWGVVRSIWSAVAGFFSGIFNAVRSVVSGVFSSLGGFASSAWGAITGVFSGVGGFFSGVFNGARNAVSGAFSAFGAFASNAYNAITGAFSGLGSFFSGLFGGISSTINSVLGGVTNTISNISGAINGIAGKLGGLFKGSMVVGLTDVNLSSSGYGLSTNSVSSDNRTYNTFNVQGGAGQDVSNLARAIRREFELGRA
ncbi:tape measure protein [Lactococcus phage 936 group phage PhiB1127]|uniref:Tape measure protein n=1 Tax=Lactococcus phage 936 group phage PhiB1127 TaxID=1636573 RepID=A0A126H9D7_9CAUD|nr:tape measure protein [Lactococcus phage 936 group phage PhiB1127]ALM63205.1 tape measure protein [Lactococcus phage 936 group phage PhiB1127]